MADFLGVPNFVTSVVLPGTEGSQYVIAGDWQHLMVVEGQSIEFATSSVAGNTFANDQTAIRVIRRCDVVVVHPEAFHVITGVTS